MSEKSTIENIGKLWAFVTIVGFIVWGFANPRATKWCLLVLGAFHIIRFVWERPKP